MGSSERLWWGGLLVASLALLVALAGIGLLAQRFRTAADYPGATLVSREDTVKVWPNLTLRHNSSYQTADPFIDVYKWYSIRFALGPEVYGLSNCIQMVKGSTQFYVFDQVTSVMVCDSRTGRLIYVTRTLVVVKPR